MATLGPAGFLPQKGGRLVFFLVGIMRSPGGRCCSAIWMNQFMVSPSCLCGMFVNIFLTSLRTGFLSLSELVELSFVIFGVKSLVENNENF